VDAVQSLVAGAARLPAHDRRRLARRRHPRIARRRPLQRAVEGTQGPGLVQPGVISWSGHGSRIAHNRKRVMAGILDFTGAAPRGGVLPFANTNPSDDNRNAILGYLAGALQGGHLGQSIGHGLAGWLTGERLDQQRLAPGQTYRALAQAGVPDAVAKAAALNPHVMRTVAPAYFAPQPFKDIASLHPVLRRLRALITPADQP